MSYLIHFNGNHSSKNGQFVSGDGDKDGIANDHAHRSKLKKKNVYEYSDGSLTKAGQKKLDAAKRYNSRFLDLDEESYRGGYKASKAQRVQAQKRYNAAMSKETPQKWLEERRHNALAITAGSVMSAVIIGTPFVVDAIRKSK